MGINIKMCSMLKARAVANLHHGTFDLIYCFADPLVRWAVVNVPKASQLISALTYFVLASPLRK